MPADLESSQSVEPRDGRRTMNRLPSLPSAAQVDLERPGDSRFTVFLWRAWLNIAAEHGSLALKSRQSPDVVDAFSRNLHGEPDFPVPPHSRTAGTEAEAALIAITASAFAIDGFYGTVKALVAPPRSRAARPRQILECLKHGFEIGDKAQRWQQDLDWLFAARDDAVHHAESWEKRVVVMETEETVVFGGESDLRYSAQNAARAHQVSRDVIETCLSNPKPTTKAWATKARPAKN